MGGFLEEMSLEKEAIVSEALNIMEEIVCIMREYDSMQHIYAGRKLYQTEAHMLEQIGNCPGINTSGLAKIFSKTASACSQIIKKLMQKGLITRNQMLGNSRIYQLVLTESGKEVYEDHCLLEAHYLNRDVKEFTDISIQEIRSFLKVSEKLRKCFKLDLEEQKEKLQCFNNSLKCDEKISEYDKS